MHRCGTYFPQASRDLRRHGTYLRLLLPLPRETHKFMIEPLSKREHIIFYLRKRFLKFVACVAQSEKSVIRNVLNSVQRDSRIFYWKKSVENFDYDNQHVPLTNFNKVMYDPPFRVIPPGELWRVSLVQEILVAKQDKLKVQNFKLKEFDEIISVCLLHLIFSFYPLLCKLLLMCLKYIK